MTNNKTPDKKSDYQLYLEAKHSKYNTPDTLLNSVVKEATGQEIVSKTKVILGEINEVYDIKTKGDLEIIVRISRSRHPRFNAEKYVLDASRQVGVPAPEVLLLTHYNLEDTSLTFCVEKKLQGTPLSTLLSNSRDFVHSVVNQAGGILAQIHSVVMQGFGETDEKGSGEHTSWLEYINEVKNEKEDIIKSALIIGLSEETVDEAYTFLDKNNDLFMNISPHLLHGDFSTKHILIDNDIISGIIDFEGCMSGDPVWDFAWWEYFYGNNFPIQWLIEGYIQHGAIDTNFDKKLLLYKLRLGLTLIHYYESEKNVSGMKHTKEKFESDLEALEKTT